MKNKDKKEKKQKYVDDGHTVYNMDNVQSPLDSFRKKDNEGAGLSRKEKRAAIRAALATYLPRLLLIIACFGLAAILLYFWLR